MLSWQLVNLLGVRGGRLSSPQKCGVSLPSLSLESKDRTTPPSSQLQRLLFFGPFFIACFIRIAGEPLARAGGAVGGSAWPSWTNSAGAAFLPPWQRRPSLEGPATHWVASFEKAREEGSGSGTWRGRWRRRWVNAADSGKFRSVRYIRLRRWDLPFWVGSSAARRWASGCGSRRAARAAERPAETQRRFLPWLLLCESPLSPGSRRGQAGRLSVCPSAWQERTPWSRAWSGQEAASGGRTPRSTRGGGGPRAGHVSGGAGRRLSELLHRSGPGRGHRDHRQRVQRPVHPVSGNLCWLWGEVLGRGEHAGGVSESQEPQACGWLRSAGAKGGRCGERCPTPWGRGARGPGGRHAHPRAGEGACRHEPERGCLRDSWGQEKPPRVVALGGLPPGGRGAAKPGASLPFFGQKVQPAPSAAAPVFPPGFSELAEPPPAGSPPSPQIFAHRRARAAGLFLPHCESRNELWKLPEPVCCCLCSEQADCC